MNTFSELSSDFEHPYPQQAVLDLSNPSGRGSAVHVAPPYAAARGSAAHAYPRVSGASASPHGEKFSARGWSSALLGLLSSPTQRYASAGLGAFGALGAGQITFRRRLQKFMATSQFGALVELSNIVMSLLTVVLYVAETYDQGSGVFFHDVDILVCSFFLCDFLLRLYLADRRLRYLASFTAIVDLITILPVAYSAARGGNERSSMLLSVGRVLRVLRIFRVNRYVVGKIDSEMTKGIVMMATNILTAAIFAAGMVQVLDNGYRIANHIPTLRFHDTLYFIIVTISTVGYGDIAAQSDEGRLMVMCLICSAIIYIPQATNNIVVMMQSKSVYRRRVYKPIPSRPYVLVCGSMDVVGARAFLTELFHEDHGNVDLNAVLLCEKAPNANMENLLLSGEYNLNVTYLQGSPLDVNDLMRAALLGASACFVLCNKFTADQDAEDASTILRALSIKRFYLQATGQDILTCVQLMRQENKQHFTLSHQIMLHDLYKGGAAGGAAGAAAAAAMVAAQAPAQAQAQAQAQAAGSATADSALAPGSAFSPGLSSTPSSSAKVTPLGAVGQSHEGSLELSSLLSSLVPSDGQPQGHGRQDPLICVNEIKMNLLAQSCLCPGIITLVGNLIMSVDVPERVGLTPRDELWLDEYNAGSEYEIYRTRLCAVFEGAPFCTVSALVHEALGCLPFALELSCGSYSRVIMNPGKLPIPNIHQFDVHAFVVATDQESAELSKLDAFAPDSMLVRLRAVTSGLHSMKMGGGTASTKAGRYTAAETKYRDLAERIAAAASQSKPPPPKPPQHLPSTKMDESEAVEAGSLPGTPGGDGGSGLGGGGSKRPVANKWGVVKKVLPGAKPKAEEEEDYNPDTNTLDFHVLPFQVALTSVTVTATLVKEFPDVRDHIIICGNMSGLSSLIRTLRSRHLATIFPVLILNPEPPSVVLWNQIAYFPQVYFLQGNPADRNDLARAGVRVAARAIVLARSISNSHEMSDETMSDAHAIFAHQCAIGMNPSVQIVTELVNASNVGFLDVGGREDSGTGKDSVVHSAARSKQSGNAYYNTRQFIAGIVFSSSMLDTLISQSFYNPHITTVFQHLISGRTPPAPERKRNDGEEPDPRKAYVEQVQQSYVFQIPVPRELVGKQYRQLFRELMSSHNMIPLGLLRGVNSAFSAQYKGNAAPYAYTNPPSETELARSDKVFVLSQVAPSPKLAGKNIAQMMHDANQIRKNARGSMEMRKQDDGAESGGTSGELKRLSSEVAELRASLKEIKDLLGVSVGAIRNAAARPDVAPVQLIKFEDGGGDDDDDE
jgi:hypothetical protein